MAVVLSYSNEAHLLALTALQRVTAGEESGGVLEDIRDAFPDEDSADAYLFYAATLSLGANLLKEVLPSETLSSFVTMLAQLVYARTTEERENIIEPVLIVLSLIEATRADVQSSIANLVITGLPKDSYPSLSQTMLEIVQKMLVNNEDKGISAINEARFELLKTT